MATRIQALREEVRSYLEAGKEPDIPALCAKYGESRLVVETVVAVLKGEFDLRQRAGKRKNGEGNISKCWTEEEKQILHDYVAYFVATRRRPRKKHFLVIMDEINSLPVNTARGVRRSLRAVKEKFKKEARKAGARF